MKSVKVVLFDVGNTLLFDDPAAWPRVYRRAEAALWRELHRAGATIRPEILYGKPDTLLGHYYALRGTGIVEPGMLHVLAGLLEKQGLALPDASVARALRAMYAVTQTNWKIEQDAPATLRELERRGFRLGVISNVSDDENARELLGKAGLHKFFETVLTSAAHGRRKPDPGIFQEALNHFEVEPRHAVMIGDSYDADILGASAVGLRTIWITRRSPQAGTPTRVVPDAEVSSLAEVPALLET